MYLNFDNISKVIGSRGSGEGWRRIITRFEERAKIVLQDHSFGADAILREMSISIGGRRPVVSLLGLPLFWHGTILVVHFCFKC